MSDELRIEELEDCPGAEGAYVFAKGWHDLERFAELVEESFCYYATAKDCRHTYIHFGFGNEDGMFVYEKQTPGRGRFKATVFSDYC